MYISFTDITQEIFDVIEMIVLGRSVMANISLWIMHNLLSAAKLQKKMHIRKSMSKKVDFCLEVREGSDLLRVHNGFIGYLDFPVITPLPLAEDKPSVSGAL